MSKMKSLKLVDKFLKALAAGFLLSFISVIVAIVLAINDSSSETALSTHFLIWIFSAIFIFVIMILFDRKKYRKQNH